MTRLHAVDSCRGLTTQARPLEPPPSRGQIDLGVNIVILFISLPTMEVYADLSQDLVVAIHFLNLPSLVFGLVCVVLCKKIKFGARKNDIQSSLAETLGAG